MKIKFIFLSLFLSVLSVAHASCNLSVSDIELGLYNPISTTPLQSSFIVSAQCSPVQSITLYATGGNTVTYNSRYLLGSSSNLNYNIYLDNARTIVWGGMMTPNYYVGNSGNITFYTSIPAQQNVPAGTYTDSMLVRLVF